MAMETTTGKTGKRRGPVPKPKGVANTGINEFSLYSDIDPIDDSICNRRFYIGVVIHVNEHTILDQVRKAAKKEIDNYLKQLIHDAEKREEAGHNKAKVKSRWVSLPVGASDKGGKKGAKRRS
jgi:hypothetical protein